MGNYKSMRISVALVTLACLVSVSLQGFACVEESTQVVGAWNLKCTDSDTSVAEKKCTADTTCLMSRYPNHVTDTKTGQNWWETLASDAGALGKGLNRDTPNWVAVWKSKNCKRRRLLTPPNMTRDWSGQCIQHSDGLGDQTGKCVDNGYTIKTEFRGFTRYQPALDQASRNAIMEATRAKVCS